MPALQQASAACRHLRGTVTLLRVPCSRPAAGTQASLLLVLIPFLAFGFTPFAQLLLSKLAEGGLAAALAAPRLAHERWILALHGC